MFIGRGGLEDIVDRGGGSQVEVLVNDLERVESRSRRCHVHCAMQH